MARIHLLITRPASQCPMINNRSTTAPDLCKNIALVVVYYLLATVIHVVSYVYIYTHIIHNIEKLVGQNK